MSTEVDRVQVDADGNRDPFSVNFAINGDAFSRDVTPVHPDYDSRRVARMIYDEYSDDRNSDNPDLKGADFAYIEVFYTRKGEITKKVFSEAHELTGTLVIARWEDDNSSHVETSGEFEGFNENGDDFGFEDDTE